jgi:hypothetical protein
MLAVQGGILGGHESAPVRHKHILSFQSLSSPLINEDLPAGPQHVFTLNNRYFRYQACYSLLPAKPGGQAVRVVSLCKYKVVVTHSLSWGSRTDWARQPAINRILPEKRKENRVIFWLRVISIYPCGWSVHYRWRVHAVLCWGGLKRTQTFSLLGIWLTYLPPHIWTPSPHPLWDRGTKYVHIKSTTV